MLGRTRRLAAVVLISGAALGVTAPTGDLTIRIVWDMPTTPVFDCSDVGVRKQYPMQCPQLGVPPLLGGGDGGGGNGPSQCGICGVIRDVINSIPGLGGIL